MKRELVFKEDGQGTWIVNLSKVIDLGLADQFRCRY